MKDDRFCEVMTKVLLERFIAHRPHPWGALVTFIELLRNTKYDFWSKDFIRIAPEVTMLLENVSVNNDLGLKMQTETDGIGGTINFPTVEILPLILLLSLHNICHFISYLGHYLHTVLYHHLFLTRKMKTVTCMCDIV